MDFQTIILDHVFFSERTGMLLLLAVTLYYLLVQNKIQSETESELKNVKEKVNQLVNRTDNASTDLSSLSSRISNLWGRFKCKTLWLKTQKKSLVYLLKE